MDTSLLVGLLAVLVAVDTVALLTLLALTVRWQRITSSERADRRVRSRPVDAAAVAQPDRLVASAGSHDDAQDPLADAISAFLGRSDGIFRAGGPPGAPTAPGVPAGSGPTRNWPVPAAGDWPPDRIAPPAPLERGSSEVRWAPVRPTRYVPSGPRPARGAGRLSGPGSPVDPAARTASPLLHLTAPPPALDPPAALPPSPDAAVRLTSDAAVLSPGQPTSATSRLGVVLTAREAGTDAAGAVDRLGPVIGGLLRERTRLDDAVVGDGPGRFVVVLPDT
ncbi:MAG TPA: hypothetical protein VLR93_10785, partial [Patescibacteria group bacterium]|nr:hypothetical protein [Patescibacteria group bacterium]